LLPNQGLPVTGNRTDLVQFDFTRSGARWQGVEANQGKSTGSHAANGSLSDHLTRCLSSSWASLGSDLAHTAYAVGFFLPLLRGSIPRRAGQQSVVHGERSRWNGYGYVRGGAGGAKPPSSHLRLWPRSAAACSITALTSPPTRKARPVK
jgi:hypothetical protein